MESTTLLISVMTGAVGLGYFVYGKKQQHLMALVSGLGLCLIPYFTDSMGCIIGLSLLLMVSPFIMNF